MANYGSTSADIAWKKTTSPVAPTLVFIMAWLCPATSFASIIYIRATGFAYNLVSIICCIVILLLELGIALGLRKTLKDFPSRRKLIDVWIAMALAGGAVAFIVGTVIFKDNFEPYDNITRLSSYPMVDTSAYTGQQFMDAGQIEFIPGSHLDLSKSYGFKNGHTYCVAPIVAPEFKGPAENMNNYDFWAVGLDCCSGHTNDFHCGEFANPSAHSGLRLMRDFDRNFYRLAVKEAKASYGIQANYPIFLTWMEDPQLEIQAHYDNGVFNTWNSCVAFGLIQFLLLLFFSWAGQLDSGDGKEPPIAGQV